MLKESKADIFVDPVLHTACALDIKHHCAAIPPGRGRRKCLCFTPVTSQSWGPLAEFSYVEDISTSPVQVIRWNNCRGGRCC